MNKLELRPVIEKCLGGWQAKASLYQNGFHCATERFNAYDDKQEAWDNAKEASKEFAQNHNKTCNCKAKMLVGSY